MPSVDQVQFFVVLACFSLLPPLLFAFWVRNHERKDPEPTSAVLRAFLFGAVIGTTVALILNTLFDTAAYFYGIDAAFSASFLLPVVAAPFIEEATKGVGLGTQRRMILELEDGLVYGAAIGLGFAATENLLYGITAWIEDGSSIAMQTVILRSVSSTILHAGASALVGFGYAQSVLSHGFGPANVVPYYLLAVAIHAAFNFLVGFESILGLLVAMLMAWLVFSSARRRIRELDAMPHELR